MFGYVKPLKGELKVSELELYKSVYCGVCKISGKSFGIFSRIFMGYDAVFVALIGMSTKSSKITIKKSRCVLCKIKSCFFCEGFYEEFKFAAASSIILNFFKIFDDIKDSKNIFKKGFYFLKLLFLRPSYRKTSKIYSCLENKIGKQIKKQDDLEKNESPSLDAASQATSEIMSIILSFLSKDENEKRILKNIGFFVGKWIYIIDAVNDFDKDLKEKNFNPFISKFNKDKKEMKKNAKNILNQTLYQILSSYNLLKIENLNEILDNIFKLGFNKVQLQVLSDNFNIKKKEFIYKSMESEFAS